MKKTIGIFAHVDAGKTTFSEQLLYHAGVIKTIGRVDHKDTLLDGHAIEKERGITIFSDQAYFDYEDDTYYLLDTPGHVDFSSEMERSIFVIDYAVIIISGVDGIQSHTETVYDLLSKHNKPVFFFINKCDQDHSNYEKTVNAIMKLSEYAVDFKKDYLEFICEKDEVLLEQYFNDSLDKKLLLDKQIEYIKNREIMPIFGGSALKNDGIIEFLNILHKNTITNYKNGPLKAYIYKVKYEQKLRQTYIKLISGSLKIRESIGNNKITSIKKIQGEKYIDTDYLEAGDIGAIVGLDLKSGDGINMENLKYDILPAMTAKIIYDPSLNPKEVYKNMQILDDEDPALKLLYEDRTKEIHFGVMGAIQLEVLQAIIKERFDYDIYFEEPKIIYKETIEDVVIGYGHFEPLKHYAEVHLKIEPGQGLEFINQCSNDHLTVGNQNLVKHHLFEREHKGILTGSMLTNLKITLLTGRAHNKHTSGGDFRQATIRALRQGLEKAKNILLEPYYEAVISVPKELMGKVMMDVQKASGQCLLPEQSEERVVIKAHVPVSTFRDYPTQLASFSSGLGRCKLKVIDYRVCHNPQEVIESIGYDKVTDEAYPSSSVFCTKGKGYTVLWDEAEAYMHC